MSNIIATLEKERMQRQVPDFGPGDTVVVEVKVKEGERERVQAYEGVVIAKSTAASFPDWRTSSTCPSSRIQRCAAWSITWSPLACWWCRPAT